MSLDELKCQLLACCEPDLEASLFKNDPTLRDHEEVAILTAMRQLAVIDVAATVRVTELLAMRQGIRSARAGQSEHLCPREEVPVPVLTRRGFHG